MCETFAADHRRLSALASEVLQAFWQCFTLSAVLCGSLLLCLLACRSHLATSPLLCSVQVRSALALGGCLAHPSTRPNILPAYARQRALNMYRSCRWGAPRLWAAALSSLPACAPSPLPARNHLPICFATAAHPRPCALTLNPSPRSRFRLSFRLPAARAALLLSHCGALLLFPSRRSSCSLRSHSLRHAATLRAVRSNFSRSGVAALSACRGGK